jgi:hypothetical protein
LRRHLQQQCLIRVENVVVVDVVVSLLVYEGGGRLSPEEPLLLSRNSVRDDCVKGGVERIRRTIIIIIIIMKCGGGSSPFPNDTGAADVPGHKRWYELFSNCGGIFVLRGGGRVGYDDLIHACRHLLDGLLLLLLLLLNPTTLRGQETKLSSPGKSHSMHRHLLLIERRVYKGDAPTTLVVGRGEWSGEDWWKNVWV